MDIYELDIYDIYDIYDKSVDPRCFRWLTLLVLSPKRCDNRVCSISLETCLLSNPWTNPGARNIQEMMWRLDTDDSFQLFILVEFHERNLSWTCLRCGSAIVLARI